MFGDRAPPGEEGPRGRARVWVALSIALVGTVAPRAAAWSYAGSDLATAALRVLLGQLPGHKPANEPLPAFASAWFEAYERGEDMTTFEGSAIPSAR